LKSSSGGGAPPKPKAGPIADPKAGTAPVNPLDADPSRSKFFDKLIRKMFNPVTSHIPPSWDGVLWYFFILYNLEQMEFVGPMVATALDTVTLSLPVAAEIASHLTEKVISLAPVPYASFVGEALGYTVSLIFISVAVILNGSRKHFGSGFKVSLEAVPIFGDMLMDAAQSVETGAERYMRSREKILMSTEKISPHAEKIIRYYSPSTEITTEGAPSLEIPPIKKDVVDYVAKATGMNAAMNIAADPGAALSGAVNNAKKAAENKVSGAVNNAKKAAENKVSGAVNNAKRTADTNVSRRLRKRRGNQTRRNVR